jgi:DNA-binding transcriptional MerR regulator
MVDGEQTIDQLAAAAGTSTRNIRSLQQMGLMARPRLRGRTGLYDEGHLHQLTTVLRLQRQGFSLPSLRLLYRAEREGQSLSQVLGLSTLDGAESDTSDLYGFPELRSAKGQPFLSVVPTTVWTQSEAS